MNPAQVQRTHCPRGHEYDEANTYYQGTMRSCKKCRREAHKRWAARKEVMPA